MKENKSVQIDAEVHHKVRVFAAINGVGITQVIERSIKTYLKKFNKWNG